MLEKCMRIVSLRAKRLVKILQVELCKEVKQIKKSYYQKVISIKIQCDNDISDYKMVYFNSKIYNSTDSED